MSDILAYQLKTARDDLYSKYIIEEWRSGNNLLDKAVKGEMSLAHVCKSVIEDIHEQNQAFPHVYTVEFKESCAELSDIVGKFPTNWFASIYFNPVGAGAVTAAFTPLLVENNKDMSRRELISKILRKGALLAFLGSGLGMSTLYFKSNILKKIMANAVYVQKRIDYLYRSD